MAEELAEGLGGGAVALRHQLPGRRGRVGEVHRVACLVEERLVVVEPSQRLHREAHVAGRVHGLHERARHLFRVQAVVDLHLGAFGGAQVQADAGEEGLQRLQLELLVEEAAPGAAPSRGAPGPDAQLLARRVQLFPRHPVERLAKERVGGLDVGDSRGEQRVELHAAQILRERHVVGEARLPCAFWAACSLRSRMGFSFRTRTAFIGGEGLRPLLRVGLLRDEAERSL